MPINGMPVADIDLAESFKMHFERLKQDFHCFKIGIIQSYNSTTKTAQVQVVFNRQTWSNSIIACPVLNDCPVFVLQGGGVGAQFPVAQGDECLLLFADCDIDNWYVGKGQSVPNSSRRHDLSDAIAIVGLNSLARPLVSALAANEGGIADNAGKVAIKAGKITVSNATQSFKTAMDTFLTACSGSADATLVSAASALKTSLDALFY